MKGAVIKEVDIRRDQLRELSLKIHSYPESGFNEVKAVAWLVQYLKDNGFSVEEGICGLPTAFRAVYGKGRPAIALLAEYDALPELGHACGHNIIAVSAIGAALASRKVVDAAQGSVTVIGTPAEELHGGKAIMAEKGAFDNIDVAMMVHPGTCDVATSEALACQSLDVEFIGREAHAAGRPEMGINALEAMIQSFNGINSLRQHIRGDARIHGIITDGGRAANVVPAHSAGSFLVRAADIEYLEELKQKVLNCFKGAAKASGARLKYSWGEVQYAPMRNNMVLAELFRQNMKALGRDMKMSVSDHIFGSTDFGNVSQVVPGIHPFVAIADEDIAFHSVGFRRAAASEEGMKGLFDAAKALAMTVVDLLTDTENMRRCKKEFANN